MEVVFEETGRYRRDTKRLDRNQQQPLVKAINRIAGRSVEPSPRGKYQHDITPLLRRMGPPGLTPSLRIAQVDRGKLLIYADEIDPIYDERVIRLHRYVDHDDLDRAIWDIVRHLWAAAEISVPEFNANADDELGAEA